MICNTLDTPFIFTIHISEQQKYIKIEQGSLVHLTKLSHQNSTRYLYPTSPWPTNKSSNMNFSLITLFQQKHI